MEARYASTATQIVASLVASAVMLSSGMSIGYPSVAVKPMCQTELVACPSQEAWVAGSAHLTMAVGCIVSGPILDIFGRKFGLICATLPAAIGWVMTGLASSTWSVFGGRALAGLASGFSGAAAAAYVAEIASPHLRSALTVIRTVSFSLGTALVYTFGLFYKEDWGIVALLCGIFPLVCLLLIMFWLPESAAWKRRPDTKLGQPSAWLTRPEVIKPLIIINAVILLRQISGTSAILANLVELVEGVDVPSRDSHLVVFVLGFLRVGAGLIAAWLCGRLGRRRPVTYSGTSMCAAVFGLSTSFHPFGKAWGESFKVFLLTMWILSSTIFSSVPQAMIGELFPTDVRGVCSAMCSFVTAIAAFVAVMTYPWLRDRLGFEGLYRFFLILSIAATVLTILILPETHGKSLEEISEMFMTSKKPLEEDTELELPLKLKDSKGSEEQLES